MGIRLSRLLASAHRLDRGEWTDQTASGEVALACPACGGVSEVPKGHAITASGIMSPIWSCPDEGCGYVDWVTLGAYADEVLS